MPKPSTKKKESQNTMASSPILVIMATLAIFGLMVAPQSAADSSLSSPRTLGSGASLTTGSYAFTMQLDCNLVLYDSGSPVWATDTGGLGYGCYLTLQSNGNLVIYDQAHRVICQTNTEGANGYYVLVLQPDRNVLVYGPSVWATSTSTGGVSVGSHNATASVDAAAKPVIINAAAPGAMIK